jgi:chromosome segregation ATPase
LHEGASVSSRQQAGADVHTYYAEVTLDNTSRRIPLESDLLTVRKTYNTQTDREDYLLNGKAIREKELFNIFESGGYSFRA